MVTSSPGALTFSRVKTISGWMAHAPSSRPAAPPAAASSMLSVINCRSSRPVEAPSATRTAISPRRVEARASSRLPTLAHAIRSTAPTAASSVSTKGRVLP
jgi:hypothetical protein